jgi:hypothetical protein
MSHSYPQVEQWLKNYQKLKASLEAVCELNHVLIRPEKQGLFIAADSFHPDC